MASDPDDSPILAGFKGHPRLSGPIDGIMLWRLVLRFATTESFLSRLSFGPSPGRRGLFVRVQANQPFLTCASPHPGAHTADRKLIDCAIITQEIDLAVRKPRPNCKCNAAVMPSCWPISGTAHRRYHLSFQCPTDFDAFKHSPAGPHRKPKPPSARMLFKAQAQYV